MYFVYVLKSESSRKYVGFTTDIERRFKEHNLGMSPYTKGRGPWKLVYSETYTTKAEALKREKFLKSGKGRELLKKLIL